MQGLDEPQKTLFNVETRAIDPYWVDPSQPLLIPVDPRHFEAHKLQLLLGRLERQMITNPAQFNSSNYIATLDRFSKLCEAINKGNTTDARHTDAGTMANDGESEPAPPVGAGNAASVGYGVSADNPFTRQRTDTV